MKITFLGATKTVTGSNYLVEAAGKKFLVDCGMWQGKAELEEENFQEFDFNPAEIDFMLLTHAQLSIAAINPTIMIEFPSAVPRLIILRIAPCRKAALNSSSLRKRTGESLRFPKSSFIIGRFPK